MELILTHLILVKGLAHAGVGWVAWFSYIQYIKHWLVDAEIKIDEASDFKTWTYLQH